MNRADRRRQAKLQKSSEKSQTAVDKAIADMIQPIVVLLNAQEFDRAEAALNDLLASSPDHTEGLHLYGLLLCQTGRIEKGIDALKRAVEREPETALYWNNLAAAQSRHSQLDASLAAARQATTLDPKYPDPHLLLANLLLAEGKTDEGASELAVYVKLRPSDADQGLRLGRIWVDLQNYQRAEEAFKNVLSHMPKNVAVMRELASIYMNTWQYDAAQQLRRQADQLEAEAM